MSIDWLHTFIRSASATCFIEVKSATGGLGIGTGFHVTLNSKSYVVTAKHVVFEKEICSMDTTEPIIHERSLDGTILKVENKNPIKIVGEPIFPSNLNVDLALIEINTNIPALEVAEVFDGGLVNSTYALYEVLVLGYPPIPYAKQPEIFYNLARFSSVIDKHYDGQTHIILSSTARSGMSGGPVIGSDGKVIGIITDSFINAIGTDQASDQHNLSELGYLAATTANRLRDFFREVNL